MLLWSRGRSSQPSSRLLRRVLCAPPAAVAGTTSAAVPPRLPRQSSTPRQPAIPRGVHTARNHSSHNNDSDNNSNNNNGGSSRRRSSTSTRRSNGVSPSSVVSGGTQIALHKNENPHQDVVQYTHKNRTWNVQHVDYYAEALAIGLTENGLTSGDVVVSWFPPHFQEAMVLQFACSKAGFVLYEMDPQIAIQDPAKAVQYVAKVLELTQANVLCSQEAWSDTNYLTLVEKVVPELRIFAYHTGMPFMTPRFPHLRFCLHNGFDMLETPGWYPLKYMVVPSGNLDAHVDVSKLNGDTPLCGSLVLDAVTGLPAKLGPTLSNRDTHQSNVWPTYSKVLNKEFHVVEGIGTVF